MNYPLSLFLPAALALLLQLLTSLLVGHQFFPHFFHIFDYRKFSFLFFIYFAVLLIVIRLFYLFWLFSFCWLAFDLFVAFYFVLGWMAVGA